MIKYKLYMADITAKEVLRETEKAVFYWLSNGRPEYKEIKAGKWHSWHDTWADAHARLLANEVRKRDAFQRLLDSSNSEIQKIRAMKPPVTASAVDCPAIDL